MIKKICLLFVLYFTFQSSFAQSELDAFKYVIVPNSFDFTIEPDQYQLNTLSKFLFQKEGFEVLMADDALPEDLINNGCLALWADVRNESNMFVTKFVIELKNCRKQVVYTSGMGQSREKKYKVAYNLALRQAFESFKTLNYSYKPEGITETQVVVMEVPAAEMKPRIEDVKTEVEAVEAETNSVPKPSKVSITEIKTDNSQVLKAKANGSDYELLNANSEIVYTLLFSGKEEFYMVKDMQATVYKKDGSWVIAKKLADGTLKVEKLNTNF
ncbi:hypothetical protein [Bizionia myxarmorum]|uniref:Secreted protein n=1 Tax=Bizionia myxarmorum TaxID=291186 RepID=A0A5D0REF8_9FLAO|nr:hypothetical protein [Bizionia myxarmorum]TYB79336.1 hypothetical protein ES674_06065 [Bizionia myxarmorum]